MRILFDITHPAHAHFFHYPIESLAEAGHTILVTTRAKECATDLVDQFQIPHYPIDVARGRNAGSLFRELWQRDLALRRFVREYKPHAMAAIGGTFIAHAGALTGTPSVVFYDTEIARSQNLITYPLATRVVVPMCYEGWLPRNSIRYKGYHELAYLAPSRFTPSIDLARKAGFVPGIDNYLIRVVSWEANHDIAMRGWSLELLRGVVDLLKHHGNVIVSSESQLPNDLKKFGYRGRADNLHHLLAFCRCLVGESATMASESAVLGVPAVFAADTWRGYTNELQKRYQIVENVRQLELESITKALGKVLSFDPQHWRSMANQIYQESDDVASVVSRNILDFNPAHQST